MTGRARGRPCVFCGLYPGNGLGAPVYEYTLLGSGRKLGRRGTKGYGTIAICERCFVDKRRGASMVTAGFRTEAMT